MDVARLRKIASAELGKRALAELTAEEDTSLDSVLLAKYAQAEDLGLFQIAMRLPGHPVHNYEAMGGVFKTAGKDYLSPESQITGGDVAKNALIGGATGASIPAMKALADAVVTGKGRASPRHMLAGAGIGAGVGAVGTMLERRHADKVRAAEEDRLLKQAFGTPMFSGAIAPDPMTSQAGGLKPPSPSSGPTGSSGPQAPSASSGPTGGGGSSGVGAPKVQSIPEPSVPGAGAGAGGGGMG